MQETLIKCANYHHGLGYNPLFAVRWCTSSQISSGVATKVYSPSYALAAERDASVPGELDTRSWSVWDAGLGTETLILL